MGSGIFRENEGVKIATFPFRTIHVDALFICSRKELFQFFGCSLVEVSHDVDGGPPNDRVWSDHLEILDLSVGEKIDWHTSDW